MRVFGSMQWKQCIDMQWIRTQHAQMLGQPCVHKRLNPCCFSGIRSMDIFFRAEWCIFVTTSHVGCAWLSFKEIVWLSFKEIVLDLSVHSPSLGVRFFRRKTRKDSFLAFLAGVSINNKRKPALIIKGFQTFQLSGHKSACENFERVAPTWRHCVRIPFLWLATGRQVKREFYEQSYSHFCAGWKGKIMVLAIPSSSGESASAMSASLRAPNQDSAALSQSYNHLMVSLNFATLRIVFPTDFVAIWTDFPRLSCSRVETGGQQHNRKLSWVRNILISHTSSSHSLFSLSFSLVFVQLLLMHSNNLLTLFVCQQK